MNRKSPTELSQERKHGFHTITSTFDGAILKKRKVIETVDQYLTPELQDSSFGKLSEETVFLILNHLSLEDLSHMSMASKATSKVIFTHTMSDRFTSDIASVLMKSSPDQQLKQSYRIGRLLKRISFLFPVLVRMKFFHYLIQQVQRCVILKSDFDSQPIDILPFIGGVLQSLIAGWDEGECFKVFKFMSECHSLFQSISRFVNEVPGTDVENEVFLRQNLRDLFLDRCSCDYDRATWIGCISSEIGTAQLAKVLILLYGPTNDQGHLDWSFAFSVRAFQKHSKIFLTLAKIIGTLPLIPHWSSFHSLEVLVYISNVPNCWLLRSFSSLLLPLSCIDKELVIEYFSILYKSGRASTASLLLGLALMVSPQFVNNSRILQEGILIEKCCVYKLITSVINNPKLTIERYVVVKKLWNAVLSLADDFAETAVQDFENNEDDAAINNYAIDDLNDLMNAWKDLSVILMSD